MNLKVTDFLLTQVDARRGIQRSQVGCSCDIPPEFPVERRSAD